MGLPRRGRRVIVAACVVAVVAIALGLLFAASGRPAAEPAAVARRAPIAAGEAITTAAPGGAPASAASAMAAASAARDPEEMDVCGIGRIRPGAEGSPERAELERRARQPEARARILDRLRASPNEMARAAAPLLALAGEEDARRCDGPDCPDRAVALAKADRAYDTIARQAASTTDPQAYGFAFRRCAAQARTDAGACRLLSAAQWARLDPGNAAPWQFMLAEARARNDRAAQDEALFRIARSQRSDNGYFDLASSVLEAAPDDDASTLAALILVHQAIGIEAAAMQPFSVLVRACNADAVKDANRRQNCAAIAEVLTERSTTMIDRGIGTAIGKQVGWPLERTQRLRGEYEAYVQTLAPAEGDRPDLSCARLRRELDVVRRNARIGEVRALREWVAGSGRQPEDFIREERAREREREDAAQLLREQAAAASTAAGAASTAAAARR